jgi:hypothetical protein
MGRTIHFGLFGMEPLRLEMRREIALASLMLNHHFTWTVEQLSIELFEFLQITYDDPGEFAHPWAPRLGVGRAKVGEDAWNAHLVVAFARWLSARLPTITVRLHDEGDDVLAGHLLFQGGRTALDVVNIERRRKHLRSHELHDTLARLDEAEALARQGVFFKRVPAADYGDRAEIKALGFTDEALGHRHCVAAPGGNMVRCGCLRVPGSQERARTCGTTPGATPHLRGHLRLRLPCFAGRRHPAGPPLSPARHRPFRGPPS